jgi:hypothetical protein
MQVNVIVMNLTTVSPSFVMQGTIVSGFAIIILPYKMPFLKRAK